MAMAVIGDDQPLGREGLFQRHANALDAIHGSTLRNGRTCTRSYTPCAT
jgi:hypothetical protein